MGVAPNLWPGHIHLPSVHIRGESGNGFDYEEDLYIEGQGRRRTVRRIVRLVVIEGGCVTLLRETRDVLCDEEIDLLEESLPDLLGESPNAIAWMEDRAREEFARQLRIADGQETACAGCGCSETRACSGGCVWATAALCSRCVTAEHKLSRPRWPRARTRQAPIHEMAQRSGNA